MSRVGGLTQALSPLLLYGVILVLRHNSSPGSSRPPWRPRGLPASVSKNHTERALMRGYSTRPAWLCQWVGSGYGGAVAMGGLSQETTVAMHSPGSVLQLHPLSAACSRALARLPGRPARVAPRERRRPTGGWRRMGVLEGTRCSSSNDRSLYTSSTCARAKDSGVDHSLTETRAPRSG